MGGCIVWHYGFIRRCWRGSHRARNKAAKSGNGVGKNVGADVCDGWYSAAKSLFIWDVENLLACHVVIFHILRRVHQRVVMLPAMAIEAQRLAAGSAVGVGFGA
jgi:hypothetical protein